MNHNFSGVPSKGPGLFRPIQFVTISEKTGLPRVEQEARRILEQFGDDLCIICVVGPYRTGKSFLMNRFIGRQKAFTLGYTTNPETRGIWMWSEVLRFGDKNVLLLDTEGLGDYARDVNYDVRIFVLSVLLSSTFIFNKIGVIEDRNLTDLEMILDITKMIHVSNQGEESGDKFVEYFPDFVWVARDAFLSLVDREGRPITADQYLDLALIASETKKSKLDATKKMIRKCFQRRRLFYLPRPVEDKLLLNIDNQPYESLVEEFQIRCNEMIECIRSSCRVMKIKKPSNQDGGVVMVNGRGLADLAEYYCTAFASDRIPSFEISFDVICRNGCHHAVTTALSSYRDAMEDLIASGSLPLLNTQLYDLHQQWSTRCLEVFQQLAKGDKIIFEEFQKSLLKEMVVFDSEKKPISGLFFEIFHENSSRSFRICQDAFNLKVQDMAKRVPKISEPAEFAALSDNIILEFLEIARGPCVDQFMANLNRELEIQKSAFISNHKIEGLNKDLLNQQQQHNQQLAEQRRVLQEAMEKNKQSEVEIANMAKAIHALEEKGRSDLEEVRQHHQQMMADLAVENEKLIKAGLERQAEAHQKQLDELRSSNQKAIAVMAEEQKLSAESHQRSLEVLENQTQAMREAVARAEQQAEAARQAMPKKPKWYERFFEMAIPAVLGKFVGL